MLRLINPKNISGTTNATLDYPLWDNTVTYSPGTYVTYGESNYKCINTTLNRVPSTYSGGTYNEVLKSIPYPLWYANTWNAGDIVAYFTTTKLEFYEPDITVISSRGNSYYYIIKALYNTDEIPSILLTTGNSTNWTYQGFEWENVGISNTAVFYYDGGSNTLSSVSSYDGTMVMEYDASNSDTLALLTVEGATINVELRDSLDNVLWSASNSGLDTSIISDWYEYFTYTPVYLSNFYYRYPRYSSNVYIHIEITPSDSGYSRCSLVVAGTSILFGDVLLSPEYSIDDYSKKDVDMNGYVTVTDGRYRDKMTLDMFSPVGKTDYIINRLKTFRAKPTVWVVSESFSNGIIYGFYRDMSMNFQTDKIAQTSLTIESL